MLRTQPIPDTCVNLAYAMREPCANPIRTCRHPSTPSPSNGNAGRKKSRSDDLRSSGLLYCFWNVFLVSHQRSKFARR